MAARVRRWPRSFRPAHQDRLSLARPKPSTTLKQWPFLEFTSQSVSKQTVPRSRFTSGPSEPTRTPRFPPPSKPARSNSRGCNCSSFPHHPRREVLASRLPASGVPCITRAPRPSLDGNRRARKSLPHYHRNHANNPNPPRPIWARGATKEPRAVRVRV